MKQWGLCPFSPSAIVTNSVPLRVRSTCWDLGEDIWELFSQTGYLTSVLVFPAGVLLKALGRQEWPSLLCK